MNANLKPLKEFLNRYMSKNRRLEMQDRKCLTDTFCQTIDLVSEVWGRKAFRQKRSLVAATYDAVMVALSRRLSKGPIENTYLLEVKYSELLKDEDFAMSCKEGTSDEANVKRRINIATEVFKGVD